LVLAAAAAVAKALVVAVAPMVVVGAAVEMQKGAEALDL
jgi:hypothetical protein